MAEEQTWVARIAEHRSGRAAASRELLDACDGGVRAVARRYPGVYFELGSRTEEAMVSLVHHVFADLDGRLIGRFPFSERTPFDAYVEDATADPEVRYHSFSARLSVTRERLRRQYAHNVRRHPAWLRREELHREVVAACKEECAAFPGRHRDWPRYGLPAWTSGARPARADWNEDEVVRVLRRRGGWSVPARVQLVLAKHGAPMYPGAISRILQDAAVDGAAFGPADDVAANDPGDVADRAAVRAAAAEAWGSLTEVEQALLRLLLAGRPYKEVPQEIPELANPTAITRALERICDGFLRKVLTQVGATRDEAAVLRPKAASEHLLAVLVTIPGVRDELLAAETTGAADAADPAEGAGR